MTDAPSPTADEARLSDNDLREILAQSYYQVFGTQEKPDRIRSGGSPSIPATGALAAMRNLETRLLSRVPSEEATEEEILAALGPNSVWRRVMEDLAKAGLCIVKAPGAKTQHPHAASAT